MPYKSISVPLSENEIQKLQESARRNFRRPRDHIRYILLSSLGMVDTANNTVSTNDKSAPEVLQAKQ